MLFKDLYNFVCNSREVPHGAGRTKILKEIQHFNDLKAEGKTDKSATILISFPQLMYASKFLVLKEIQGKRWGEIAQQWKCFFDHLKNEGMKLIFFTEAFEDSERYEKLIENKTKVYYEACEALQNFEQGENLLENNLQNFRKLSGLDNYLEENLKCYGTWMQIYDEEVELAMARYAKENKVFAVLTDKIEFLFYEGHYRVWRIRNIDFDALTTKEINKFNFRKALGLFPEHMPLFGTLCTSDQIPREKLKTFQNSFPEKIRIKSIAKYVIKVKPRDAELDVEKVAKRIGCSNDELSASLEKYELNHQNPPKEEILMQKLRESGKKHVYSLLKMNPIRIQLFFEDLRKPIFDVSVMEMSLWLQRCFLGIVFKERNDPNITYPVWTMKDHQKGFEVFHEFPEYPPFDVPPLEELIFAGDKFTSIRIDLVKWFCKCDFIEKLHSISEDFVPIVLTLNFLIHEGNLNITHADILLLSFFDTIYDRVPILPEPDNKNLDVYPFQLTYSYLRVQSLILRIISSIGLKKWTKFPDFNGIYFHHLYKIWEKMDDYAKTDRLNEIQHIRIYATTENDK